MTFQQFMQIAIVILFVVDITLHVFGKSTDTQATYQIVCDIFMYLLWFPKDNER